MLRYANPASTEDEVCILDDGRVVGLGGLSLFVDVGLRDPANLDDGRIGHVPDQAPRKRSAFERAVDQRLPFFLVDVPSAQTTFSSTRAAAQKSWRTPTPLTLTEEDHAAPGGRRKPRDDLVPVAGGDIFHLFSYLRAKGAYQAKQGGAALSIKASTPPDPRGPDGVSRSTRWSGVWSDVEIDPDDER